ncbi:MAG: hypothetical protein IT255_07265 [Chitinophagaceae bacterium]|nr:hypothetical protein [Chitinophagaceae bacterium]
MKTPSEKLFSVISSMDKHEKRYFKTHSYKNSDLLNLFDAINKQKIYNENKLKKVFRNNPVFVNFKVLKSNLLKVLIKSLSDYHSSISVDSKLLNLLQQAEVFEKKNLIEIAEDFLGKAEKIAADNDRHNYLLMIVYFKTKLSRATSLMPKLEYYLNTESVKEDTYLKTVKTNIAYQRLFIKSHIIYNLSSLKSKENLQAAKSLIKSPLLRENNKPSDFYSLNQYYQLHFFYSMYTNKWSSRVYIQQKEWISYLEEDKEKLPIRALTYIGSLVNLMVVQYKLNKNEEFENSFGKSKLFFESLSPKIRSEAIVSNFAVYNAPTI